MRWDSEEGQKVLAVAYALQTNYSNAASTPKWYMEKLIQERVHRAYNYVENKWIYSLESIENVKVPLKSVRIISKGRKTIPEETIAKIRKMRLEGYTVRFIAERLQVGRGTVEKYMS